MHRHTNAPIMSPTMIMVHRQHNGKQKRPICGALSAFSLQSGTLPHLPEKIMDQSLFLKQQQSEVAAERRKMPIHISRNILIPPQVYICPYTILSYMITQTKTGHIVSRFMLFLYIVSSRIYRQISEDPRLQHLLFLRRSHPTCVSGIFTSLPLYFMASTFLSVPDMVVMLVVVQSVIRTSAVPKLCGAMSSLISTLPLS